MRNRMFTVALLCVATSLLVACPQVPEAPISDPQAAPPAEPTPMSKPETASTPSPDAKAKRAPGQEGEPLMAWRAFGTEPFWQARVDGGDLYFSTPENPDGRLMHGQRVASLVGFVYTGKNGDKDFNLDIRPGDCNDGMSDNRYEYVATFIYGDVTYKGCAEAAK